jgi:hypothetical protein
MADYNDSSGSPDWEASNDWPVVTVVSINSVSLQNSNQLQPARSADRHNPQIQTETAPYI